jgi:hypothetical protein
MKWRSAESRNPPIRKPGCIRSAYSPDPEANLFPPDNNKEVKSLVSFLIARGLDCFPTATALPHRERFC